MRCKVICDEINVTKAGGKIKFSPVTSTNEENSKFFKWTPFGNVEFGLINKETLSKFEPGKEYYLDFTESE